MDCKKVDSLMMKYMDKNISVHETEVLKGHIDSCMSCKLEFSIYDELLVTFSDIEIMDAPPGFECGTMSRIDLLTEEGFCFKKISQNTEAFMCAALGVISIIVAGSFMLIAYSDQILKLMDTVPYLSAIATFLRPLSVMVESYAVNLTTTLTHAFDYASGVISGYKLVFFGIVIVLATVHFILSRRKKVNLE